MLVDGWPQGRGFSSRGGGNVDFGGCAGSVARGGGISTGAGAGTGVGEGMAAGMGATGGAAGRGEVMV